jgi:hypothetical protein
VLWNDISWPADEPHLFALFADYYNACPMASSTTAGAR